MKKIGITGSLYSGVDKVCDEFNRNGVPVFDADVILKFLLNWDVDIINDIKIKFGRDVYQGGELRGSVFNNDQKMNSLIDLTKTKLMNAYENFCNRSVNSKFVLFKSHFIFESRLNNQMDSVINVYMPKEDRIKEIKKHIDTFTYLIQEYLSNELPDLQRSNLSNFVVSNYVNSEPLDVQVKKIIKEINGDNKRIVTVY